MNTQQTAGCAPADFGDPTAFDLGDFRGRGCIEDAIATVRSLLDGLTAFDIARVQFYFNGTPAVMSVYDTPRAVLVDWNERRTAYQKAAGSA